jgi:radical SAM protein with 4Fe4S-binding SPASM domain
MVGLGEPTVARNFARNLERLREAIPRKFTINLNTNGTTLHSAKVTDAIIGKVDSLTVSINGYDEESYHELNGIPGFEETLTKTQAFLGRKNGDSFQKPATRVQVMNTKHQRADRLREFKERLSPVLAEYDSIHEQPLQTLAGVEEPIAALQAKEDTEREALIKATPIPCFQVWYHAFVTAEGDVYPCCIAGNVDGREERRKTELYLGNLNDESMYALWNGEKRHEIMRQHLENQKPAFCEKCPIVTMYNETHWRRVEKHAAQVEQLLEGRPVPGRRRHLPVLPGASLPTER